MWMRCPLSSGVDAGLEFPSLLLQQCPRSSASGFTSLQVLTAVTSEGLPSSCDPGQSPSLFLISVSTHPWKLHLVRLQILKRWKLCCLLQQMSLLLPLPIRPPD